MATIAHLAKVSSGLREVTDLVRKGINEDELGRWYHGKNCPRDVQVWCVGQALRLAGIPWCSGLSLLWACGRLAPCVSIAAQLLYRSKRGCDYVEPLWQMLAHAEMLYKMTSLDGIPSLVALYLKNKRPQETTIRAVIEIVEKPSRRDGAGDDAVATEALNYINRELAKLFWLPYDKMQSDIHRAALRAFDDKPLPSSGSGRGLVPIMLQIAKAAAPISVKREVLLNFIGQWLNALEGRPPQPDAREVKAGFDDAVYPDLRRIESYRRFQEWFSHPEARR